MFLSTARHLLLKLFTPLVPDFPRALLSSSSLAMSHQSKGCKMLRMALNKTDVTYHHYVARSILNSAKQAEDNNDDVEEVG